jgi:hypothetical protein
VRVAPLYGSRGPRPRWPWPSGLAWHPRWPWPRAAKAQINPRVGFGQKIIKNASSQNGLAYSGNS